MYKFVKHIKVKIIFSLLLISCSVINAKETYLKCNVKWESDIGATRVSNFEGEATVVITQEVKRIKIIFEMPTTSARNKSFYMLNYLEDFEKNGSRKVRIKDESDESKFELLSWRSEKPDTVSEYLTINRLNGRINYERRQYDFVDTAYGVCNPAKTLF